MKLYLCVLITVISVSSSETRKCVCDNWNEVVNCSRLNLTDFRESDFFCDHVPSEINLSQNAFREYPNALSEFKIIVLSWNAIEHLYSRDEQDVEYLDITENNVKKLDLGVTFLSLTSLNASGNYLGIENSDFLKGRCHLKHLDVSKNKIRSLQSITKCTRLSILLSPHNMISTLPDDLAMLTKLTRLDVSRNNLLHVSGLPRSLEGLDLSLNELGTIGFAFFQGLSSLTELRLYGNKISILDKDAFVGLTSLKQLLLQRNKLTVVTRESFVGLKSIQFLELSDNDIEHVTVDSFSDLHNLEEIRIDGNLLKSLPHLSLGKNVSKISFMLNVIEHMDLSALLTIFSGSSSRRAVNIFLNPISGDDPEWPKIMRHFDWECLNETLNLLSVKLLAKQDVLPRHRTHKMATTPCSCARFFKGDYAFGISINAAGEINGLPWFVVAQISAQADDNTGVDSQLIHEEL